MASLSNINDGLKDNCQHYASNDSGLSINSNNRENYCQKHVFIQDFMCDDLTKSLFINSFEGNDLIQDDDIYSYKSKMEFSNLFLNKFSSLNLTKTENSYFKNPCSFSSIIQDLENLKLSDKLQSSFQNTSWKGNKNCRDSIAMPNNLANMRISNEIRDDVKSDSYDKMRLKRSSKKNGVNEYLSSSIKDYQGDKALNDIVSFIQGSVKPHKIENSCKTKVAKTSVKVDTSLLINTPMSTSVLTIDSGVISDTSSPQSNEAVLSSTDTDSGTPSSHFVSLNNSDEDSTSHVLVENFKEVLSKKQKKNSCLKNENSQLQTSKSKNLCNLKVEHPIKISTEKPKKSAKPQSKNKRNTNMILISRETFHDYLSDRYMSFTKKYNMVS